MKNHILKTYFKLYLVLFLISFFFNSCQKDEIIVFDEIGVIAKSHKSVISYNDFLSQFYFLKSNTKSSFSLEKYKFGSDCSVYERNDSESIIKYIDTSSIVAFQYNNISTFTFKAETSIDSQNTFVNLVVSVTQDETSSVLLKYIPDETWINDTSLNYSGEIYQIDELGNTIANYSQSTSQNKSLNRTTTVCAFSVSTITITCTGIDHETGLPSNHSPGEGCTCGDSENSSCSPPYDYNFVSLYCVTVTTGGGDNSSESGSGGYYETSPTQNPDGTYNLPDAITPTDPILEFVSDNAVLSTLSQHLNLNIEDFNFLDANPKVARSLFNFLDNNDFTNASAVNSVYKVNEIFKGNTNSTILSTLYEHKSYLLIFGDYLTLTNFKLFPEFAEAYTDVANSDNLNLFDHQLISTKTDEIYTIIQQYSSIGRFSSISSMSDAHQQTIASNAVFTTSLSQ